MIWNVLSIIIALAALFIPPTNLLHPLNIFLLILIAINICVIIYNYFRR